MILELRQLVLNGGASAMAGAGWLRVLYIRSEEPGAGYLLLLIGAYRTRLHRTT